jgi:Amt family ammonium transporter
VVATLLALLSAAGILVSTGMLALFSARLGAMPVRWSSVLVTGAVGILVGGAAWLTGLTGIPAAFAAPVIALGGFFAVLVTLPLRERNAPMLATVLFAAILTALVFAPAVTIVFALWYDPFATGIGYLDLGAALPTEIAAGGAVFGLLLFGRSPGHGYQRPPGGIGRWSMLWPALGLWAGWLAWLVGLELAFDRLTPLILADAVIMPIAAVVARTAVERARHRSNSVAGMAVGLLAGCAAATPAAGYLTPLLAATVALVAGALSGLLPREGAHSAGLTVGGTVLVAGGTSVLLLGFLAKDVGFVYTGQPEIFFGQAFSVLVGGAGGFVLALLAWSALRRIRR